MQTEINNATKELIQSLEEKGEEIDNMGRRINLMIDTRIKENEELKDHYEEQVRLIREGFLNRIEALEVELKDKRDNLTYFMP